MTSTPPPGGDSGPDGSWSYQAPDRGSSPTPGRTATIDPLSQRLLKAAAGLSALLILVIAFAWLHGSDEASLNPIAEAAARTQEQPGSRIAMRGIYAMPAGHSMTMHGSGLYNARTGRSRLAMELTIPGLASPLRFDAVADKQTMYMRSRVFTAELPPGDRWLATQMGLGNSAQTSLASNSGSEGQLEMLRAAGGKVEDLGEETVRGVATTRYRGTIDLNRYADLLREEGKPTGAREYEQLVKSMPAPVPVEAWLDDGGLVRRMRMVMDIPTSAGAPTMKMDLTMEFFDFGIAPKVDLPPANETFDATPLGRAQLHLLDGSTMGVPARVSDGRPLSLPSFRRQGNAICGRLKQRASHLLSANKPALERMREADRLSKAGEGDRQAVARAMHDYDARILEPIVRLGGRTLSEIASLAPPPALRSSVQRFLHFGAVTLEIDTARNRALEVHASRTLDELKEQFHAASHKADQAARQAKLGACTK
ncbi:MAG TPA: hypothetical protein VFJ64_11505 [Solirubrobacterales bacterium]|nr:hypothetical protein [Solirubrobacterales bacterium]